MSITYPYTFIRTLAENTEEIFTVQLYNASSGVTRIIIPGLSTIIEIIDSESKSLGNSNVLKGKTIIVMSDFSNMNDSEDTIDVDYSINKELVQKHSE